MRLTDGVYPVTLRHDGAGKAPSADRVTFCNCCTSTDSTYPASAVFPLRRRCCSGSTLEELWRGSHVVHLTSCG